MLMGAANILLKDKVKDFDDCIVAPFIRSMFRWNMQWNPREDIKGDFEVVASGSQSLVAREVRAQQVPALINYMGIPSFAPYIRAAKIAGSGAGTDGLARGAHFTQRGRGQAV